MRLIVGPTLASVRISTDVSVHFVLLRIVPSAIQELEPLCSWHSLLHVPLPCISHVLSSYSRYGYSDSDFSVCFDVSSSSA